MPLLVLGVIVLCGCTNIGLVRARSEIAKGDYAGAHQTFARAGASTKLSAKERREIGDGLCLTEYKIGAPRFSLAQQYRTCASAAEQPNSQSGSILAHVERAERAQLSGRAEAAIRSRDFADAEAAIADYQAIPGADARQVSDWSHQLWSALERDPGATRPNARSFGPAISRLTRRYSHLDRMSNQAFRRWIEDNITISGTPLVSAIQVGKRTVDLWIDNDQLSRAALNLDRFTLINDAQVARCRCDGQTNIAMQGSGLPAYLVRLDPATQQSEVLILAQP